MAYAQTFHGVLDFDDADVLQSALTRLDDTPWLVARLSEHLRSPHTLCFELTGHQPASQWDAWCAALATLAEHACLGRVVATLEHQGHLTTEQFVAESTASPVDTPHAASSPLPARDHASYTYRLERNGRQLETTWTLRGCDTPIGRVFALGPFEPEDDDLYNDWLLAGWMIARASQWLTLEQSSARLDPAGQTPERLLSRATLRVDLAAPVGSIRVTAAGGGDLLVLYERLPDRTVAVPAGRFAGCTRLRVETWAIGWPPDEYPTPGWRDRIVRREVSYQAWAPGVGLVALRDRRARLALTAWESSGPRS